jgi:glycosyltransferase involved in cell wall biosynthesis
MRIGIDAREIQDGVRTGIGRALKVFLDYFITREDEHVAVLFSSRPLNLPDSRRIHYRIAPPTLTFLWDQLTLPRLVRQERVDLFYSTYYKVPLRSGCPVVSTIYDLMYLTCPVYRNRNGWSRFYYATVGRTFVKKAARVITSSEFSKDEIVSFYRIPPEKVSVIPLGLSSHFQPVPNDFVKKLTARIGIQGDYILYTGNFKPHKNVGALIEAFGALRDRYPDLLLVLAGNRDHHGNAIGNQIERSGLSGRIIIPGAIDDDELPALYSGARLFVMPSLYEGFGYPPVEAMACGVPVICSNATSLGEVVSDAALMVDARNSEDIAGAVGRILDSPEQAKSLATRGLLRARAFTNGRYAGALYSLLLASSL